MNEKFKIYNPDSEKRILCTRQLPGTEWLDMLIEANCRVEVNLSDKGLSKEKLMTWIGGNCKGIIGQLTEKWDADLFKALKKAGGIVYCNYAVGYDNVDLASATENGILVANTPGVLTETTAEMAMALTMACARRIVEADGFTRTGKFEGWLPDLFLGKRLWRGTVGIIGAGRIGLAYAMMMVNAFEMNLIYFSRKRDYELENNIEAYNEYLEKVNKKSVKVQYSASLTGVLELADIISLHVPLTVETRHLITEKELQLMKKDAILINTSRGAVVDEQALVLHCQKHPDFTAGLDVFEKEPVINDGLKDLDNITMAPHIASATRWTRESMAKLAAQNIINHI